ncbi:MAG: hypothetical protein MJY56_07470 [Bacteroidales bacterium]|nr:hypothetical protein [Bacteroidales bacterium]
MKNTVLYIHGMGGGEDSRIPGILSRHFDGSGIEVVVRTYSFGPSVAAAEIASWVAELEPGLIIGESLGACHALRVAGLPHLFVSPSLGGPLWLGTLSWLALIPGVRPLFNRIYRPAPGRRQTLDFRFSILRKYLSHWRLAMKCTDPVYAYFGTRDRFRRSGVVSVRLWKKHFGEDTYTILEGTHHMSEEHVVSVLAPAIVRALRGSL